MTVPSVKNPYFAWAFQICLSFFYDDPLGYLSRSVLKKTPCPVDPWSRIIRYEVYVLLFKESNWKNWKFSTLVKLKLYFTSAPIIMIFTFERHYSYNKRPCFSCSIKSAINSHSTRYILAICVAWLPSIMFLLCRQVITK